MHEKQTLQEKSTLTPVFGLSRHSTNTPNPTPSAAIATMYWIGAAGSSLIARLSSTGVSPPAIA